MNEEEAEALTGLADPLLGVRARARPGPSSCCAPPGRPASTWLGHTDDEVKRETRYPLLPGAIPEFNRYEFSRPMHAAPPAKRPIKVFAHIAPYHGGPERITSTNGAGDAALAALLHDMAANRYHTRACPELVETRADFLTYSSMSQVCRYANRVSYEVLAQASPRLTRAPARARGGPRRRGVLGAVTGWARR
jgi:inosine kinase